MNVRTLVLLLVPLWAFCACHSTAPREDMVTAPDGLVVSYEIRGAGSLEGLTQDPLLFRQAKEFGYSDIQIACLVGRKRAAIG